MHYRILKERIYLFSPSPAVVMAAVFSGQPEEALLRAAIQKAVRRHDLLCSHVELDPAGNAFFVVGEPPSPVLDVKNVENGDAWREAAAAQQLLPFDWEHGEFLRFTLLRAPENAVLIMAAHHLVGDGLACMYLLRDVMAALGNPSAEPEPLPFRPMERELTAAAVKLPFLLRIMLRLVNRQWRMGKRHFTYQEYRGLFDAHWRERRTQILADALGPEILPALREHCRAAQVSVNSALVAAFLRAAAEDNAGIAVSLRPGDYEGMGNYATGISIVTPRAEVEPPFWVYARTVHRLLHDKLDNPAKKNFLLGFMNAVEPSLIDAAYFNAFGGLEHPAAAHICNIFGFNGQPKGVSVTNLGVLPIPREYGAYTIKNFWFVPPLVPNAQRLVGAATLGDTLHLTFHFDAAREEEMRPVFERALALLTEAARMP